MAFDFDALRDILACPKSKSKLVHVGDTLVCTDANCRLRFEIRDEIPVMLVEEATQLAVADWNCVMQQHSDEAAKDTDDPVGT